MKYTVDYAKFVWLAIFLPLCFKGQMDWIVFWAIILYSIEAKKTF